MVFAGNEHPVVGSTQPETLTCTLLTDHSFEQAAHVNGQVTQITRVSISADGRTLTRTTTGTDSKGRPFRSVGVYDRHSQRMWTPSSGPAESDGLTFFLSIGCLYQLI